MIFKYFVTLSLVTAGSLGLFYMLRHYEANPWTRNGQVRAQIIQITPEVNGQVVELPVSDNQFVREGELLFKIDPRQYEVDVEQAEAELKKAEAREAEARAESERSDNIYARDKGAIPELKVLQLKNSWIAAKATVLSAKGSLHSTKLNLANTEVKAPTDGYVTNLKLRIGSQATAQQPALALIDRNSFWVHGFFKETQVERIRRGNQAVITLMSNPDHPLEGVVNSVGWGISHSDGSTAEDLLPSIRPTFEWIRLAQRFPVRIHFKKIPEDVPLRVGATASVLVRTDEEAK